MKKFRFALATVFTFLMIYFPPIIPFNMLYLLMGVSVVYLAGAAVFGGKVALDRFSLTALLVIALLIAWELVVGRLNGFGVGDSANDLLLILGGFVFNSIALRSFYLNSRFTDDDVMKVLFTAGLLQGLSTLLAYIYHPFQQWFISRMVAYGYSASRFTQISAIRWYGMGIQLGFATPVVQVGLALLVVYQALRTGKKRYWALSVLLIFSAVINARLAALIFIAGLVPLIASINRQRNRQRMNRRLLRWGLIFVAVAAIALYFMRQYAYSNYKWLVNGLLDFFGFNVDLEGVYSAGNYFVNADHYRLPTGIGLLLGYAVVPGKLGIGYSTDIGYVLDVWRFGILLTPILYVGLYVLCRRADRIGFARGWYLGATLLLLLLISNIKGNIISATPIASLVVYFACAFPSYGRQGEIAMGRGLHRAR